MRMAGEVLLVWLTALIVPTVLVLLFLHNVKTIGISAYELIQKQLNDCRDRETQLQCRVEAMEAKLRANSPDKPLEVALSVTPGSTIQLTPPPE